MTDVRQVLVIDDDAERLRQLAEALRLELGDVPVETWQPVAGEQPVDRFQEHLQKATGLIVTDHDLTPGVPGLLGSTITGWSQERFIPVCNFSRKPKLKLPRESNFFELRVPTEPDDTARAAFVARIYRGFQALAKHIADHHDDGVPVAGLLAGAIGHPELQDELGPYITSVGSANSAFLQSLREADEMPIGSAQADFQTFILGHVLANAILEFSGPILSRRTLAAYCALDPSGANELGVLFSDAEYKGPFGAPGAYFVRSLVDDRIDQLDAQQGSMATNNGAAEVDEYNHDVVVRALNTDTPHGCERCGGARGGFWCPFTERPVCNREDCSVQSTTWIPRGATLCRVERDYYDEWAPLLGE